MLKTRECEITVSRKRYLLLTVGGCPPRNRDVLGERQRGRKISVRQLSAGTKSIWHFFTHVSDVLPVQLTMYGVQLQVNDVHIRLSLPNKLIFRALISQNPDKLHKHWWGCRTPTNWKGRINSCKGFGESDAYQVQSEAVGPIGGV